MVGATVGVRLGRMLSFYVAAEDDIYGTRLEGTTLGEESRTQNDVQIAVGFAFRSGGDARTPWLARNPQLDSGCGDYQFRSSFVGDM